MGRDTFPCPAQSPIQAGPREVSLEHSHLQAEQSLKLELVWSKGQYLEQEENKRAAAVQGMFLSRSSSGSVPSIGNQNPLQFPLPSARNPPDPSKISQLCFLALENALEAAPMGVIMGDVGVAQQCRRIGLSKGSSSPGAAPVRIRLLAGVGECQLHMEFPMGKILEGWAQQPLSPVPKALGGCSGSSPCCCFGGNEEVPQE